MRGELFKPICYASGPIKHLFLPTTIATPFENLGCLEPSAGRNAKLYVAFGSDVSGNGCTIGGCHVKQGRQWENDVGCHVVGGSFFFFAQKARKERALRVIGRVKITGPLFDRAEYN